MMYCEQCSRLLHVNIYCHRVGRRCERVRFLCASILVSHATQSYCMERKHQLLSSGIDVLSVNHCPSCETRRNLVYNLFVDPGACTKQLARSQEMSSMSRRETIEVYWGIALKFPIRPHQNTDRTLLDLPRGVSMLPRQPIHGNLLGVHKGPVREDPNIQANALDTACGTSYAYSSETV